MDSVTASTFKEKVLTSTTPVLVDFYADWCGPCRAMTPILEEVSKSFAGRVSAFKLDIDVSSDLCIEYGVKSIPTFILFKDGKVVETVTGAMPKTKLEALFNKGV